MKKTLLSVICIILAITFVSCSSGKIVTDLSGGTGRVQSTTAADSETTAEPVPAPDGTYTVCLDAGHGYVDPGCSSIHLGSVNEAQVVGDFVKRLGALLEDAGYKVVYLRDDDKYITAAEVMSAADKAGVSYSAQYIVDDKRFAAYNRTIWANVLNKEDPIDCFISFHADSYEQDESIRGTRTYYCVGGPYSEDSERLSQAITDAIEAILPEQEPTSNGTPNNDSYIVTKYTEMPSVLVEMGFCSNPEDAKNLTDENWLSKFADGILNALNTYFAEPEETT